MIGQDQHANPQLHPIHRLHGSARLPPGLRCMLHRTIDQLADSGHGPGQAGRCALRATGRCRPLPIVRPAGAPGSVQLAATLAGHVRQQPPACHAVAGPAGSGHGAGRAAHTALNQAPDHRASPRLPQVLQNLSMISLRLRAWQPWTPDNPDAPGPPLAARLLPPDQMLADLPAATPNEVPQAHTWWPALPGGPSVFCEGLPCQALPMPRWAGCGASGAGDRPGRCAEPRPRGAR